MTSDVKTVSNEKTITNKDLTKMCFNVGALGMEFSWNYPRQMHMAFCLMIEPLLKKIYKNNPKGYKDALVRHMAFFNITPQLAPFVGGIVLSMEEKCNNNELDGTAIDSVKAALMGPLSGIGDSIFLGCIRVIAIGVGLSLAKQGSILGPILYVLIYNIPAFLTRVYGARLGYNLGFNYLDKAQKSGIMDKLMFAAGIVGIMVVGSMSCDMFGATIGLKLGIGKSAQTLQEVLDSIMPGIVALGVTWLYYWALGKKVGPVTLIIITIVLSVVSVHFGIFAV